MDPAIWSALPEELVHVIFAHLPAVNILGLSALSKEWRHNVTGRDSKFRQVCSQFQGKIFGIICGGEWFGTFLLRYYDTRSQEWHTLGGMTGRKAPFDTMGATDGGLVCMIERKVVKEREPLRIVVCNPLTRVSIPQTRLDHHVLPDCAMTSDHPSMVQLRMDPDSQTYTLFCVRPLRSLEGVVAAEAYQSASDAWTSTKFMASSDLVFGHGYTWEAEDDENDGSYFAGTQGPPCVFDPADGQLLQLVDESYPCVNNSFIVSHVLVKDRLFVMYALGSSISNPENPRKVYLFGPYVIIEYQAQKASPHWKKLRDHKPPVSDMFPNPTDKYRVQVYACQGILLVTAQTPERRHDQGKHSMFCSRQHPQGDFAMYCDLSQSEEYWHSIPAVPDLLHYASCYLDETMCELRWDVLP